MKQRGMNIIILIILIVIVAVGVLYFAKRYNLFNINNEPASGEEMVDLEKLAADYRQSMQAIMPYYEDLVSKAKDEAANSEVINDIREQLLELKMPEEFKDLHLELVLLLDKIEDNISSEEAQAMYNDIINQYEWLAD